MGANRTAPSVRRARQSSSSYFCRAYIELSVGAAISSTRLSSLHTRLTFITPPSTPSGSLTASAEFLSAPSSALCSHKPLRSLSISPHSSASVRRVNMSTAANPLAGVKALLFDVFGTVVDWEGSVHRQLGERVQQDGIGASSEQSGQLSFVQLTVLCATELDGLDMLQFTRDWRAGYMRRT